MASTSTSAASVHKQSVSSSSCSRKTDTERRRSCDTVCSSNSSCFLQKRKAIHPLAASLRIQGTKTPNNIVKQRVLSAKLLKLKSVQSQLNDANFHLAELLKENRALRTLQKRQDKALKNYEGVNADLPRLIKCHEDEMRVLQEKNKVLKKSLKEAQEQIKFKDDEINSIRSQLRHLSVLTKDKHLGEREKLKDELEEIKEKMKNSENQINLLNRRLMLEMKNAKYKLNNEIAKHKQCRKELTQAMTELHCTGGNVNELNDGKTSMNRKRTNLPQRQSMSCVSLGSGSSPDLTSDRLVAESSPDIKLEPIISKKEETSDPTNDIIKNPAENIKARLSSANLKNGRLEMSDVPNGILKHPPDNMKSRFSTGKFKNSQLEADRVNNSLKKLNIDESNEKNTNNKTQPPKSIYTVSTHNLSRSNSSHKLDAIADNLQTSLQRSSSKDVDQRLGDYCLNVVNSVKSMNNVVDKHKDNFDTSKTETQRLLEQLKLADMADAKLRQNKLVDEFKVPKEDIDIVNRIWFEEYSFQESKKRNSLPKDMKSIDKNGNLTVRDTDIVTEDKKSKLLATLRAIDNGEVVENLDETVSRKTKVMKEIFGESDR